MSAHRVVIVGGGFGGLQATRGLRCAPVEITLIDRRNFHLFQPLSYQVATGALSPGEVAYPLDTVSLEWDRDTDQTQIVVADIRDASLLVFPVPGVNAGEAFRLPFRYAQ